MLVLSVRTAVNPQKHRIFFARHESRRTNQQRSDREAILVPERYVLSRTELKLGERRIVDVRQCAQSCAIHGVNLRRSHRSADTGDRASVKRDIIRGHDTTPLNQPLHGAPFNGHSRQMHRTVIAQQEAQRLSVRTPRE